MVIYEQSNIHPPSGRTAQAQIAGHENLAADPGFIDHCCFPDLSEHQTTATQEFGDTHPPIPGSQNALEILLYTQLPPQLVTEIGHSNWSLDEIQFNSDNTQAMLWMAESDEDEDILAREPEMVLAIWDESTRMWQLHQMSDEDFISVFMGSDFKDSEIASRFFPPDADPPKASPPTGVVYGGYKLPWKAGLTKRLTWSVAHGSCYPKYYCTYAFDFADGTMFEILASKGGLCLPLARYLFKQRFRLHQQHHHRRSYNQPPLDLPDLPASGKRQYSCQPESQRDASSARHENWKCGQYR